MRASQQEMMENQKDMKDKMKEYRTLIMTAQTEFIQSLEDKLGENRKQMELELTEVKREIACIEQKFENKVRAEVATLRANVTALKMEDQTVHESICEASNNSMRSDRGNKVKPFITVDNGLLKRVWESNDGDYKRLRVVVLKAMIEEVLEEIHSDASEEHVGIKKTL